MVEEGCEPRALEEMLRQPYLSILTLESSSDIVGRTLRTGALTWSSN